MTKLDLRTTDFSKKQVLSYPWDAFPERASDFAVCIREYKRAIKRIRELEDGLEEALYMLGAIDLDGNVAPEYHDPDPDAMKPGVRRALNAYTGHMEALADD